MAPPTRKVLCYGTVITPGGAVSPGIVVIDDGLIVAVGRAGEVAVPQDAEAVEAAGAYIVPGYVDLHIHGLLGHNAMGPALPDVIAALPSFGVTSFLATTLTQPLDRTVQALETMTRILRMLPLGARCLGVHLEGPFLAPSRAGMARAEWFAPLTWEHVERCLRAADGQIRLLTLAPELPGGLALVKRLARAGVVPSIGHSDASYELAAQAVALGLRHATHTFNAMRPLHHRDPGAVGAVMHHDAIVAEVIADGIHVHPVVVDLLLRLKGVERVALVSDAAPQAGLPDGAYDWDGQVIHVSGGACRLADGTISGAHALLDAGVRTLVHVLGYPLERAVRVASTTPADEFGLRAGRLEPGYFADVVLLDESLRPIRTFVGGREVFRRVQAESVHAGGAPPLPSNDVLC